MVGRVTKRLTEGGGGDGGGGLKLLPALYQQVPGQVTTIYKIQY